TLELALSYNCASICIEAVAYQETLIFWFEELIEQFNIEGICLYPINPRKQSKTARIRDAILQLKSGDILVYPKLQAQVYRQISNWKPARTHNEDDILDVLAYSRQVLQEHGDSFPLLLSDNSKEFSARCVTSSELFPLM
ncbi:MAG: hypothetical protein NZ533_12610, partial [Casimicrobiaceae bacterium]|nr:hypothetical protein [Casimicrobiaceae bacterium]